MKLPKWIKRAPKSNVGVKSIVKSSAGHGSDGAAGGGGGGGGGGNSQRHRRKSSSASLKGKRKRNSYVSSAITTKNFYPAEHFFKTAPPPPTANRDGDEMLMAARFRTLPATFGAGQYHHQQQGLHQPAGSVYYHGQQQQQQQLRPHPLGLPNGDGLRNTIPHGYAVSGERLYRDTLAPTGMQSAQHQPSFAPQQSMTLDRRYFAPNGQLYRTPVTDNGLVSKPYHQGQHGPPPPPPPPSHASLQQQTIAGFDTSTGAPNDRRRQILPTSATGLYSGHQQQQQQRGLRGSFRRYKIPSPAEIFEMINDKYIHPVGAGLTSKRKAAKVGGWTGAGLLGWDAEGFEAVSFIGRCLCC
uniref:Uncharacterized protein n=1 Tax=Anopheles atroparvus TaxID=41427 RepID=A0A182JJ48_ANOAO